MSPIEFIILDLFLLKSDFYWTLMQIKNAESRMVIEIRKLKLRESEYQCLPKTWQG
jgi:hypothetical protein